ncbi:MAG: hypothetical protein QNI88_08195 [Desulfobacterales bacterium]|nr:hypothetical protein [Desulfobacterales bacterium]
MTELKIATFNCQWMISIFNGDWNQWDGTIRPSFDGKRLGVIRLEAIPDVPALCERIAGTIQDIQADIIGVQEGPPLPAQMAFFVQQFLNDDYAVYSSNARSQTIHALVRRDIEDRVTSQDPYAADTRRRWNDIPFQPWGTVLREERRLQDYYRRPLMLTYTAPSGAHLDLWVLHTKSKISSLSAADWEEREAAAVLDAVLSRQKLSAEIYRLREQAELLLSDPEATDNLVIMGDFNDGPLAEDLEREFLIHNIIDELVGSMLSPGIVLQHAMTPAQILASHTTEFHNPLRGGALTQELIDHIVLAPAVANGDAGIAYIADSCIVEDLAFDAHFDEDGHDQRGLRPSDHRPLSARLDV